MIGQDPTFTVSEFVAIFNQSLDMMYPQVVVVGEISNFRVSKNRWVYFDLKDEYSSVKFFGSVHALPGPLEDGITCEVIGKPRLHNQFGFSVNFQSIRAVGEGSLRKAQDLLLKKLEQEGLFDPARKRTLPYPPQRIGLITSAESAAIADFRKIISERWPSIEIQLIDCLVQGAQAPAAIVSAVQQFNAMSLPPEVLVVIRGGGSADDLAAFSEESVVRAIAASRVPTIVAIGHENDISLAELAADVRASTPSNAAELLVPDVAHERMVVQRSREFLSQSLTAVLTDQRKYVHESKQLLNDVLLRTITMQQQSLQNARVLLTALDPRLPLKQGYALVRDSKGKRITTAKQFTSADSDVFSLEFTDEKLQINRMKSE